MKAVAPPLESARLVPAAVRDTHHYEYPSSAGNVEAFDSTLVTATAPFSARSEAFRTLRGELILRWMSAHNRCLAVTACRSGQGSAVLAANLAIVFAQMGERVLLIDANLRAPSLRSLFRRKPGLGLSELLTERTSLPEAVAALPPFDALRLLSSGAVPPNPQELVSRTAFASLLESARAEFDLIIVNTPPILDFADARVIVRHTEGCLLSVQRDVTRIADVNRVKTVLEPTGAALVGAVMSG